MVNSFQIHWKMKIDSMSLDKILELKKPSITAIQRGTYKITLYVVSHKYHNRL